MLWIDESCWPLAFIRCDAPLSLHERLLFRQRFASWLLREDRFALVVAIDDDEARQRFAWKPIVQWHDSLRDRSSNRCVGIAAVLPRLRNPAERQRYSRTIRTTFGCAGSAFGAESQARAWAEQRLLSFALDSASLG